MWSSEKSVGMVVAACFLVDTDGSRACSFSKLVCDDDSEQEMLQRLRWPGREQPAERSTWKKPAGVRRGRVGVCVPAGERELWLVGTTVRCSTVVPTNQVLFGRRYAVGQLARQAHPRHREEREECGKSIALARRAMPYNRNHSLVSHHAALARGAAPHSYPNYTLHGEGLKAVVYTPDPTKGYYRSSRYDWGSMLGRIELEVPNSKRRVTLCVETRPRPHRPGITDHTIGMGAGFRGVGALQTAATKSSHPMAYSATAMRDSVGPS